MKTKTKVKAGSLTHNHNESQVRDAAPGQKVQTNVKAGALDAYHPGTRRSVARKWSDRAQKSRRLRRMQVEVLEERQLLATITVNTTADDTTAGATLSLRQAIEISDGTLAVSSLSTQEQAQVSGAVGATNTIDFNIPTTDPGYDATTGVWTIAVQIGDAGDQHERGDHRRLQPAGGDARTRWRRATTRCSRSRSTERLHGSVNGLTIGQQGSQVLGLDIENFVGAGVVVTAGGQRAGRRMLHRHRPDGEDRRAQRQRRGDRELVQPDRRAKCRRSQHHFRQRRPPACYVPDQIE